MTEVLGPISNVLNALRVLRSGDINTALAHVECRPMVHTSMQVIFNYRMSTPTERSIFETVVSHATQAEKRGPGAFDRFIELLLERFEAGDDRPRVQHNRALATLPRISDVDSIINRSSGVCSRFMPPMIVEALRLAGFAGRVIVEKTSAVMPSVELVRGYSFDLGQLLPLNVSFSRTRVACIDGYVENVSELHHLLEEASESKDPCVIFLRGLSDDVLHTLKVNYDRGSLRVIPVKVQFDLDGMNTLVDLSVVSGADLVSSLKGDLISSVRFKDLSCVEQLTIFNGKVVIVNTTTGLRVNSHVAQLRSRRADVSVDDVGNMLDKRIKSLSPNHVVLRIPDDRSFVINSQAVDRSLRTVRSIIDHGVTEQGSPVAAELAAQVYSDRCHRTLLALGASLGL